MNVIYPQDNVTVKISHKITLLSKFRVTSTSSFNVFATGRSRGAT